MRASRTTRLYLHDDHCFETEASVVAVREDALAFDHTCFYPGGGGQPPDQGTVTLGRGELLEILSVHADEDEVVWHVSKTAVPPDVVGWPAKLMLDRARRLALTRHHTVLHVLDTIALRDYVEIEGFDAQACGGTHVGRTSQVGRFSIFRTENKGRINKRLYVRLEPAK